MSDDTHRLGFAIRDQSQVTRAGHAHRHEFLQMRLDIEGEACHSIGPRSRLLGPGSVSFVLPYRIHRSDSGARSQFYLISFHHRFLRPDLDVDPICVDTMPFERAPELAPFTFQDFIDFRLDGNDLAAARDACRQMKRQSEHLRLFSVELIRANLMLVIGLVCQRYERELAQFTAAASRNTPRRDALMRITCYVKARLSEHIRLTDIAASIAVSPNQVTRVLKRETGKTFMQFVTEQRLQKAQELLANTSMRIAEVGEAAGFDDNAYFARRFRQYFRISPRAYRDASAARLPVR